MRRTLYEPEHADFRESWRAFLQREAVPHADAWEREGIVPRAFFAAAGAAGFLAMGVPEAFGGAGVTDFRFNAVIAEEAQALGLGGVALGVTLHNDICLPYFLEYCTDEQRERWLPGIVSGELITAIAMTEPGTGSDLASIAATAHREDGHYRVNGSKTFITNGINADLVITAVKTDPSQRHAGLSLVVLERGMEGFERGRNLEKIGQHSQDTAELFFQDVLVPVENRLGEEGQGFRYLTANLAQERLSIGLSALAAARAGVQWTVEYVRERRAFGAPIGALQNTRFVLAECHTEVEVGTAYADRCVEALEAGELTAEDAAAAKLWLTELQGRVLDRCLQLFGGYGYVTEYPIARAYADARITRIYGGTSEIMKEIVGRSLRLG
ncbi:MAG: acyl-CoA dehydrogenase family protein [Solirubrobacteraceae bacterium]|jgi:alkylation response protein AidB-like acyl-CoA dehydrogenase|nr:acyl-CoA dehydrogenase family protein [Solirubrobacteraceae bacterium]MCU0312673.1 acyl-CoA dehydrogenase family protein [Solirubrobacteraceae bacterium]